MVNVAFNSNWFLLFDLSFVCFFFITFGCDRLAVRPHSLTDSIELPASRIFQAPVYIQHQTTRHTHRKLNPPPLCAILQHNQTGAFATSKHTNKKKRLRYIEHENTPARVTNTNETPRLARSILHIDPRSTILFIRAWRVLNHHISPERKERTPERRREKVLEGMLGEVFPLCALKLSILKRQAQKPLAGAFT